MTNKRLWTNISFDVLSINVGSLLAGAPGRGNGCLQEDSGQRINHWRNNLCCPVFQLIGYHPLSTNSYWSTALSPSSAPLILLQHLLFASCTLYVISFPFGYSSSALTSPPESSGLLMVPLSRLRPHLTAAIVTSLQLTQRLWNHGDGSPLLTVPLPPQSSPQAYVPSLQNLSGWWPHPIPLQGGVILFLSYNLSLL